MKATGNDVNRIGISSDTNALPVERAWLRRAAKHVLCAMDFSDAEISLYICDEEKMRALNAEWRGRDQVTDVLSFAQREGEQGDPDDVYLGDIVICSARAKAQAAAAGIQFYDEIQNLLVHGAAHLVGYDHERGRKEAKAMREFEAKIKQKMEAAFAGQT